MTAAIPKPSVDSLATTATPAAGAATGTPATAAATAVGDVLASPEIAGSYSVEQRLLAVDALLADPEAIPDPLEVELYAYREQITGETVG